jgi:hypothetical protein
MTWPFPKKLLPAKPVGPIPVNPDNFEEALL